MRTSVVILLALTVVNPASLQAANRCPADFSVQNRLEAELNAAHNLNARERAAIADLRSATMAPIRDRYDKHEIDRDEYNRLTEQRNRALDCIEADNKLKDQQAYYTEQVKLINAGCKQAPVGKMYVGWMKEAEEQKAKACAKADLEYLTGMVRQLKEIQADKLAREEKSTPAVKAADTSQKQSQFCGQIRSVTAEAATFFTAITKEKKEKWFIEPGTLGSKAGVKISDLAAIDEYVTAVTLSQEFLSTSAKCGIKVGTEEDVRLRIVPTYACDWNYDRTTRRELEERTDRLMNLVRGCFGATAEADDELNRHEFVADGKVNVSGDLYYGEGKPSRIYLEIKKHTPAEDKACIDYGFRKKPEDRQLCMARFRR